MFSWRRNLGLQQIYGSAAGGRQWASPANLLEGCINIRLLTPNSILAATVQAHLLSSTISSVTRGLSPPRCFRAGIGQWRADDWISLPDAWH